MNMLSPFLRSPLQSESAQILIQIIHQVRYRRLRIKRHYRIV